MENALSPCVCQYVVYHHMMYHVSASQLATFLVSICFHINDASTQHVYKRTFAYEKFVLDRVQNQQNKPNKKQQNQKKIEQ